MNIMKKLLVFNMLFVSNAFARNMWSDIKQESNSIVNAIFKTAREKPLDAAIGIYCLAFKRDTIKHNIVGASIWGASMFLTFLKNYSQKQGPQNFIFKTAWEQPFLLWLAGNSLLYHKHLIKHHPLISVLVGERLLSSLAWNYD